MKRSFISALMGCVSRALNVVPEERSSVSHGSVLALAIAIPSMVLLAGCGSVGCGDLSYGLIGADGKVAPFSESAAAFRSAIAIARANRVHDKNCNAGGCLAADNELPRLEVAYGQFLVRNSHPTDALKQFDDALSCADCASSAGQISCARALDGKTCALVMMSRFEEAMPVAQQSIKAQLAANGVGSPAYAESLGLAGDVCHHLGRLSEAENYYRACLLVLARAKAHDSQETISAQRALGECLHLEGKDTDARPFLQRAYAQIETKYRKHRLKYKL